MMVQGSRASFTPDVVAYLKRWLRDNLLAHPGQGIPYLTDKERSDIADSTGLTVRQVSQWFQNRRKDYASAVRAHIDYASTLGVKE